MTARNKTNQKKGGLNLPLRAVTVNEPGPKLALQMGLHHQGEQSVVATSQTSKEDYHRGGTLTLLVIG